MAWFVVQFEDRPDALAVRERHIGVHLDWLAAHRDTVVLAGSVSHAPGAKAHGGAWIVKAENGAALDAMIASDPFMVHGLRARHHILCWNRAFADQAVTL